MQHFIHQHILVYRRQSRLKQRTNELPVLRDYFIDPNLDEHSTSLHEPSFAKTPAALATHSNTAPEDSAAITRPSNSSPDTSATTSVLPSQFNATVQQVSAVMASIASQMADISPSFVPNTARTKNRRNSVTETFTEMVSENSAIATADATIQPDNNHSTKIQNSTLTEQTQTLLVDHLEKEIIIWFESYFPVLLQSVLEETQKKLEQDVLHRAKQDLLPRLQRLVSS